MLFTNLSEARWIDPWQEFDRMRRALSRLPVASNFEFPAVNVWLTGDNAVITTELPGVDPATIDISVSGKTLTLKGSRQPDELAEGESYHRRERWYGQFSKTVELPFNVQADRIQARYAKGVLSIELPRAEAERPKKIEITSE